MALIATAQWTTQEKEYIGLETIHESMFGVRTYVGK